MKKNIKKSLLAEFEDDDEKQKIKRKRPKYNRHCHYPVLVDREIYRLLHGRELDEELDEELTE